MKRVERVYFLSHLSDHQLIKQICVSLAVRFLNFILDVPEIGSSIYLQNLCAHRTSLYGKGLWE